MASYKLRVQQLNAALHAIEGISTDKRVLDIANTMLSGGTLSQSKATKKVRNLMTGTEIEIPVGTPLCCDPSSETYWSM